MATITENEKKFLQRIYNNEYQHVDGEATIENAIWSIIENNHDKGIAGSLVKKGLIGTQEGETKNDDMMWLTKEGYQALQAA